MKIASNLFLPERSAAIVRVALLAAIGIMTFASTKASAADTALPVPSMPAPFALPQQPLSAVAPQQPALQANLVAPPRPAQVDLPKGQGVEKNISALEEKVSDNAKGVVRHLDSSSDALTLEDLNNARQTVARIEAMIDVEKHLAELEKLRGERNGGHSASLASAIPASALTPPPVMAPAIPAVSVHHLEEERRPVVPPAPPAPRPEISRIYGTGGLYVAVLKFANGDTKSVKAGDHVSDDATVRSITSSSVGIEGKDGLYTLHVKNVDAIYSAMR